LKVLLALDGDRHKGKVIKQLKKLQNVRLSYIVGM